MSHIRIWGHRGAPTVAAENTVPSALAAIAAGADGIECDVRLSADGHLVVIHDETLDRTTDGAGPVAATSLADLRRLGVPALEEMWDAVAGRMIIEIKGRWGTTEALDAARALVAFLEGRAAPDAIASSFDLPALEAVRGLAPNIVTGVLTSASVDAASHVAAAVEGGHQFCFLPVEIADEAAIALVREAGCNAVVWTVDDVTHIRALQRAGAYGVITNDPAAVVAATP